MSKQKISPKRLVVYVLGLFLLACGVSLSIRSSLGVAPVSSVALVLGNVLGVEVGNMTIAVFSVFVLIEILLLRREFHWIQLLQVPCAVLFGKFVTLSGVLFQGINPTGLAARLLLILLAALSSGAGVMCYLTARLIPNAADGLVQVLSDKLGHSLSITKNVFDLVCVTFSTSVSLLVFHRLEGIGLGTVLMAILVGRALWLFTKLFGQALERFLYGEEQDAG
ncbi:MAG: hypothetical protein IKQ69_06045 [Oscillospiraceae bacterium]|nr:hypothetical protein [Oscillospiraceae bacterium]